MDGGRARTCGSAAAEPEWASAAAAAEPSWVGRAVWRGIWQAIAAVLLTAAGLWSLRQASALVRYLILAQLLAFALEPAVMWLHQRRGWHRGSATGLLLGGILVVFVLLGALLAPALANGVNGAVNDVDRQAQRVHPAALQHHGSVGVQLAGVIAGGRERHQVPAAARG